MQSEDKKKESKQREERILFGSSPEPKTFRLDTNRCQFSLEELSGHRDSYSEDTTQKSELFGLLGVIVVGFIIAVVGAVALFWLWPAYSHSIAVIPGATVVFFGGGIIFLIGGPIIVLSGLYDFFFGSKLATVEIAAKTFFESLEECNWTRAWNCLTPKARESFEDFKNFKEYHSRTLKWLEEETERNIGLARELDDSIRDTFKVAWFNHSLKLDNAHFSNLSEDTCIVEFDLIVKQTRSIHKKNLTLGSYESWGLLDDGQLVLPQSKGFVFCRNHWLVTSGLIDTP